MLFSSQFNFKIHQIILPTSFRENLNKNSLIEVVMWCFHDFLADLVKLYDPSKKTSENEPQIILNPYECWPKKIASFVFSHLGRSLIVLKQILNLMPSWPWTSNWIFFWRQKIFKSSGVPIRLLTQKNSLCQIVQNIMKTLHASFKRFSQTGLSARLNFVNFSLQKNLT